MAERYPDGSRVEGEVVEVRLLGAKVRLDDGQLGFIRRRELSWDQLVRHPEQIVAVGQRVAAVVMARDDGYGRLALSLRQAQYDPWSDFEQHYEIGQRVHGIVIDLVEYGAFVEIMRGVRGLVHISEITDEWVTKVEDYLWRGDHVEAFITKIDREEKHVSLSIKECLNRMGRITSADISRRQIADKVVDRLHAQHTDHLDRPRHASKPKRILVVDDHDEVRGSLSGLLTRHGHSVTQASDGQAALEQVLPNHDLIFMDIDMPGLDGLEATRQISERYPHIPVVIITSINWAEERSADLAGLKSVDVLLKPLDTDEVLATVEAVHHRSSSLPVEVENELVFFERLTTPQSELSSLAEVLGVFLRELREELEADAALIIYRDRISGEFSVMTHDSRLPLELEAVKYDLAFSPVREVIEDETTLFEDQAASRSKAGRYQKLLPLILAGEFNSCIGVPVRTSNEVAYGLFLFRCDAGAFTLRHFRRVLAASIVMGASIERVELLQQVRQSRQFMLAGQLSASLIHEINNRLSTLGTDIRSLQLDLKQLETMFEKKHGLLASVSEQTDRLTNAVGGVIKTAQTFQRLIKADRLTSCDINQILRDAYQSVRQRAYQANILIDLELDPKLPPIPSSEVRLMQVFVNVLLNAVQQCRRGATVRLTTSIEEDGRERPLKIRFADTGPGIHRRNFERIFEFGFTTRPDGSGMGLFISRGLIESLSGRILVESSYVLGGTTFLIELPLNAAS